MLTWILLFVAAVVVAFVAIFLLFTPRDIVAIEENVVELHSHDMRRKIG